MRAFGLGDAAALSVCAVAARLGGFRRYGFVCICATVHCMENDTERTEQIPVDTAGVDDVPPDAWERDLSTGPVLERIRSHPCARARYEAVRERIEQHQATLAQVRKARTLTQQHIAERLHMDQSEVSRLEHRSNMLLSTLRSFVRATGGDLHLIATFPDAEPVHLQVGAGTDEPAPRPSAL